MVISPSEAYIVGRTGSVLHTTDSGNNWSSQIVHTDALWTVWASGPNDVYVGGVGGAIYHSTDGGVTWPAETSGTTDSILDIWGQDASNVFALTQNTLLYSSDGGTSWSPVPGAPVDGIRMWGTSATDLYVIGYLASRYHYDGSTWSTASLTFANPKAIYGNDSNTIAIFAEFGNMDYYNGTSWEYHDVAISHMYGIAGSSTGFIAVGVTGWIFTKRYRFPSVVCFNSHNRCRGILRI